MPGTGIEPVRSYKRRILSPMRLPVPPSGQMIGYSRLLLVYNVENLIKNQGECKCNIWQYLPIHNHMFLSNLTDKEWIFRTFLTKHCRQSFYPELSKLSFFEFSPYISILPLFYQSSSHFRKNISSPESKSWCTLDHSFMSCMSGETVGYSNH